MAICRRRVLMAGKEWGEPDGARLCERSDDSDEGYDAIGRKHMLLAIVSYLSGSAACEANEDLVYISRLQNGFHRDSRARVGVSL